MSDCTSSGETDRLKVLVVDDEPDVREVITHFVTQAGCDVTSVSSGETALSELERNHYDVVVSDIRMRGMDGVELLRRVREKWPSIEFIIISGNASVENAIEALRHGAYDILLKPVRMEKLSATIQRCRQRVSYARENRELRLVVDRLTELNNRKEKFVAVANHELRTPTTIAAGLVTMLKKRAPGLPEETAKLILSADEAMTRLKEVVRDIGELATARSLEQWVKPSPVTVAALAGEMERSLPFLKQDRNLEIIFRNGAEGTLVVKADQGKVVRAVGALIQNAVKFTPDTGKIEISISREGGMLHFKVADEGVGIPAGEEEKIFDLFYTVGSALSHHTSSHEFGGTGLGVGLSLARTIALAHGGNVATAPNPGGKGSVFTLSISAG